MTDGPQFGSRFAEMRQDRHLVEAIESAYRRGFGVAPEPVLTAALRVGWEGGRRAEAKRVGDELVGSDAEELERLGRRYGELRATVRKWRQARRAYRDACTAPSLLIHPEQKARADALGDALEVAEVELLEMEARDA